MSLAKEPSSQDVDEVDLVRTSSTKTHLRPPLETINSEGNDNTQDKDAADNDEEEEELDPRVQSELERE